jgi:hypothetical protein
VPIGYGCALRKHLYQATQHALALDNFPARPELALKPAREALEIMRVCCGTDTPRWARHAKQLAVTLIATGGHTEARNLLAQATSVFSSAYGPEHADTTSCAELVKKLGPT